MPPKYCCLVSFNLSLNLLLANALLLTSAAAGF